LTVTIDGGKFLATGKLTFDPVAKRYRLEATGTQPDEKAMVFEGSLDRAGKLLALDRVKPAEESSKERADLRISLWPNANFVRYTMTEDIKEPGALQFKHKIEVGLIREGESLAGASTTAERPKCIVTGGAASMTLTHQGRTYPICCTGCLEEFNENPEKYIKKAALMSSAQAGKSKPGQPAASRVSRFEDAFARDIDDSAETSSAKAKSGEASPRKTKKTEKAKSDDESEATGDEPASKPGSSAKEKGKGKAKDLSAPATKAAARAATLLRLGRACEKDGKTAAALGYYRRIVKDYPETPSAKSAAERIKALDRD
jgi:YHS domain-containing protein